MKRLSVFAALLLSVSSFAANKVIAYQGRLEKDGVALNGAFSMTFTLFNSPTAGSSLWSEAQTVIVSAGVFSVTLGSATPLTDSLLNANNELYLSIAVKGSEPTAVTLQNRQKLHAVPMAVRSDVSQSLVISSPSAQTAVGAVTADNTILIQSKDAAGNPRIEIRQNGAVPFIDLSNNLVDDYTVRLQVTGNEARLTTATGAEIVLETGVNGRIILRGADVVLPCQAGFTSVSGGRLCVGPIQATATGHTAQGVCKGTTPPSHVCMHSELQQACGGIVGFTLGAANGWYGDMGSTDDAFQTWNSNTCNNNNSGNPASGSVSSFPYRCCY